MPEPSHVELTGASRYEPRQDAVFDISGPPHAFSGFVDHGWRALADPVLAHRRHQSGELRFLLTLQMIQRPAHAQAQGQRRFAFQCQVRQHVLHQWLFAEQFAADRAVRTVMAGLGQGLAHQRTGTDHAIEAGHGHHFDDGGNAAPLFADHPRQRTTKLHFAGGVGAVAELVFQALDVELIARVIRAMARQQETGQALVRLRKRQKGIAHRRRTEPLVPHQFVSLARTAGTDRISLGGVGTNVGATLFLGHGHANGDPGLMDHADVARVVFGGKNFRQPLSGQIRLQTQCRHAGERHGQRAATAGFGLAVQIGHGRAGNMGTVLGCAQGKEVRPCSIAVRISW